MGIICIYFIIYFLECRVGDLGDMLKRGTILLLSYKCLGVDSHYVIALWIVMIVSSTQINTHLIFTRIIAPMQKYKQI